METLGVTENMSASKEYQALTTIRQPFIERAKLACAVTTPALSPVELKNNADELHYVSQGVGSMGTNCLASKLMLALFPVNMACFRLLMEDDIEAEAEERTEQSGENIKTVVDEVFSKLEQKVVSDFEASGDRNKMFQTLKLFITTGNVLLDTHNNNARVIRMSNFVVQRDPTGQVIKIITEEEVAQEVLKDSHPELYATLQTDAKFASDMREKKLVKVYTRTVLVDDYFETSQEVYGHVLEDSKGKYPKDNPRYIVVAPNRLDGEDYGRPYVEEFIGDLITLEYYNVRMKQGAEIAAKFLLFVDPQGTVLPQDIVDSENGDVITGSAQDVTSFQAGKFSDWNVVSTVMDKIEQRLQRSFLMNGAVQRSGERVTASEIRLMIQDLENTVGGLYSLLSEELQKPFINRKIDYLRSKGKLPQLPKKSYKVKIVTGIEALGRGNDKAKLMEFIATLMDVGPEIATQYINFGELYKRLALADGIETKGLIKTEEEIQQEQQQAQMQEMASQMAPQMMQGLAQNAELTIGEGIE